MIKKLTFLSAAAMSLAFAVPAQAQWTAFTPANTGPEYWDNPSSDGASCNIGFVVTGVAGTAGNSCANQRPAGWLPFTPAGYDVFNATPLFSYMGGAITIVQLPGLGGDVAGQDQSWGYWSGSHAFTTDVNAILPHVKVFGAAETWGLWVKTTDGSIRYSDTDLQFARFAKTTGCGLLPVCGPLVVGIEDINTSTGGDRDYQDMIAFITVDGGNTFTVDPVPEPSTYALMAAGLAALGLVARRRRNNA